MSCFRELRTSLSLGLAAPLLSLVLGLALITGCGDDESGTSCERNEDCGNGQVCTGGQCVDSSGQPCRETSECGTGQICEGGVCVMTDAGGGDMGADLTEDQGTPDAGQDQGRDLVVQDPQDEEVAQTPPEIVSTTPADGATGVAIDAPVVIEWDQAMDAATFTATNLELEDWAGQEVVRRITYNAPTFEVSMAPIDADGYFEPASPFTLTIAREVRGLNGMNPAASTEITFFTEGYPNVEDYATLAETYAPVVYAEVREPLAGNEFTNRIDWFTAIDFDGDDDVANNLDELGMQSTDVPAHVYWNVLETETHYLIQYVFYFGATVVDDEDTFDDAIEHDFAYSTVVVQKRDDDELGAFVMAEGLGDGQVYAFALDSYPDDATECGGEEQPACRGASPQIDDVWVEFSETDLEPAGDGDDEPGRRYPVYLSMATHASCLMPAFETEAFRVGNRCTHLVGESGPFMEDNAEWSRVLRPGDGDNWGGPDSENIEMTYSLSSFLDLWWTQRANEAIWGDSRSYTVPPEGAGSEGSYKVPSTFATSETPPSTIGRRTPFQAEVDSGRNCSGCSRVGTWFVDPAWEIAGHAEFDHEFSGNYCFNPYLAIDRRGEEGCD